MPSNQTASQRRRRKLRKLAHELERELGADGAAIVYRYGDGWTVRRIERRADQLREGHLMSCCLRDVEAHRAELYSLRDDENLPCVCFEARRNERDPRGRSGLQFAPGPDPDDPGVYVFLGGIRLHAFGRGNVDPSPAYMMRLLDFAASYPADRLAEVRTGAWEAAGPRLAFGRLGRSMATLAKYDHLRALHAGSS